MIKKMVSSVFTTLRNAIQSLFGQLNWKKPNWLDRLNNQFEKSPKSSWAFLLIIAAALWGGHYAWENYKNQPKPILITATITAPNITPNDETLTPENLIMDFGVTTDRWLSQAVAPLAQVGKPVTAGIQISPQIDGQWYWNSDSQLMFYPSEDWPAGTKYSIHFNDDFFVPTAKMESHEFSFTTKPFEAKIVEFKLYQDPVKEELRNAVATVEFNYPVDPETLEKYTQVSFQTLDKKDLELVKFTYSYDQNKRKAYLHTSPIKITDQTQYLLLTLDKGIKSSTQSAATSQQFTQNLLIPDSSSFFTIVSAKASIIRNDKDRPEQIITVETSLGSKETDFNPQIQLYLLPIDYPASANQEAQKNFVWQNPGEVTASILALSTPLTKESIPEEHNYSNLHSFKFSAQTPRYIYLKINKGVKGLGGFSLKNDYIAIVPVPEYPKEIGFLHKGSLLALSSEQKLSTLIRGVSAVKFEFARVLPDNVNQLVTQTQGDFNNPYFINPSFNQNNLSQIFSEIKEFDASDLTKTQYAALDIGKYLNTETNSTGPRGLFLLQATGWDTTNNYPLDVKASRMILVTDLAMVVKDNQDGSHDVFVQSIESGSPVEAVNVSILGKNGEPILSRVTDASGRVNFPSFKDFVNEREPTAYLAQLNTDVSFIPFANGSRQVNYSKFDIGGLYTYYQQSYNALSAYIFSDRGIYRPGDTVHIGLIIKQAFAKAQPEGLPVQASVVDSRGTVIKTEPMVLNNTGFLSLDFTTNAASPTGDYTVNLFLVVDELPQNLLGSTTVRISEFLPDRMKIKAELVPEPNKGWTSPTGLKTKVELANLYGAPATDRKISTKILLTPKQVSFDEFPDFIFSDPLFDPKKPPKVFNDELPDTKTNDQGIAEINLNLEQFEKATYQLTVFTEGFEAEGGRSVTTQVKTLVSPLSYFVGSKSDGDLSFIKQNDQRHIQYIAVNPQLQQDDVSNLKVELVSLHPVSTLIKNADGTYQYQSVIQSKTIQTQNIAIPEAGFTYTLPTQDIGDYGLNIIDKDGITLNQLKFSVVGESKQPMAMNAELSIKLNQSEFKAGDDIELQITSPYSGSGLITIERDRVYATQWFKTDSTTSVQHIHIPEDFQGNGYVNVAFVRSWDSPEIFVNPLSYSIEPFSVSHEQQQINIKLNTPKTARPGESLVIDYQTDKPGKILIFAVDEGILQVARYETPDPLAFFFQKHALEVQTQQTVDQILPKFIMDRELSAVGGDDAEGAFAGLLNPFKRKTDLPVVFWSGIMEVDTNQHQITYSVPDYFNGSLKVMAVAVSEEALGTQETQSTIKGDFIINPNAPTFVSPGDQFEVSASIANNLKDSGENASLTVELMTTNGIEIVGGSKQEMKISEGHEASIQYQLKANQLLGSKDLQFKVYLGDKSSTMKATLSVRPASPKTSKINSGHTTKDHLTLAIDQNYYPEFYKSEATFSSSPLILLFGLEQFLKEYPYGCTEQLTTKAMPLIAMNAHSWFPKDQQALTEQVNTTIELLSQRQMSTGGFSYWPNSASNFSGEFASVYAMHFLTEARAQGFNVPSDLFYNGLNFLKELAGKNPSDIDMARLQSYAIYILTRNELVTTNYLTNLMLYLQKSTTVEWHNDITAVYIASTYQLLKNSEDADQLLKKYHLTDRAIPQSDFNNIAIDRAQYLYLIAKHFPSRLQEISSKVLPELVEEVNNDRVNTLLSGFTSLALGAYPEPESSTNGFSVIKNYLSKPSETIEANNSPYENFELSLAEKSIELANPSGELLFYQLLQSGFSNIQPKAAMANGIEVYREFRDATGQVLTSTTLGKEIEVHIQIRALNNAYLSNIVIQDLLPGGFEVVRDSVKGDYFDYVDIREDRVNLFLSVDSNAREISYKIKATNQGVYLVPPIYANSMYNPLIQAHGVSSKITISD